MTEQEQRLDQLAQDVLRLSRNTLLVNLRFLDAALSQFTYHPAPGLLATDGQRIYYDARALLLGYRQEKERPVRDYLHMVLHCVFRHNFVDSLVDHACWDLACDMAVEAIISELDLRAAAAARQSRQAALLGQVKAAVKDLTAEKIYRWYLDQHLPPEQLAQLRRDFCADDHRIWYLPPEQAAALTGYTGGTGPSGAQAQDGGGSPSTWESRGGMALLWKDIAERMQTDMETFSRQRGDRAGNLVQNLRAVNREKYDYTAFLKKFAVLGEAMKVNDDEFDYIFYTYGMKLYGNMPLIERLEYKEVKRIREFVVAIDTSGSVSGELVQKFMQKTYNILKQEESFFRKINLHIIQCDADIQEDAKITR